MRRLVQFRAVKPIITNRQRKCSKQTYSTVALLPPMSTNECLAWYNVVLTPRSDSSVKDSQLGQSANICDVSEQPTCAGTAYQTMSPPLRPCQPSGAI